MKQQSLKHQDSKLRKQAALGNSTVSALWPGVHHRARARSARVCCCYGSSDHGAAGVWRPWL